LKSTGNPGILFPDTLTLDSVPGARSNPEPSDGHPGRAGTRETPCSRPATIEAPCPEPHALGDTACIWLRARITLLVVSLEIPHKLEVERVGQAGGWPCAVLT